LLLEAESIWVPSEEEPALLDAWKRYRAVVDKLRDQVRMLDLES
jgi:hypothetical protein